MAKGTNMGRKKPMCHPELVEGSAHWKTLLTEHLQRSQKPLVVILGPTASGKTAFSIEVARWMRKYPLPGPSPQSSPNGRGRHAAELINADSRQLYKHMDIGTAKITEEEMCGVPHHLFSVLDPKEKVTVGWYKKAVEKVIDDVFARGALPILVGGSMLYISAVTDGYIFTGKGGKRRAPTSYDLLIFGMQWTREELVRRIEKRTAKLLGMGERGAWVTEVAWLLAHSYSIRDPGMESHGYREIAQWILQGRKEEEFPSLVEHINAATRQYAKRQMTWWKGDERIHWIPCN